MMTFVQPVFADYEPELPSLYKTFSDDFMFGTFSGMSNYFPNWQGSTTSDLIQHHYNSWSPANEFKPDSQFGNGSVSRAAYDTVVRENYATEEEYLAAKDKANRTVTLAPMTTSGWFGPGMQEFLENVRVENAKRGPNDQIKIKAHVLVWHNMTNPSFFRNGFAASGEDWASRDVMLDRLDSYIKLVLTRYAPYNDIIYSWDVANEVIDDYTGYVRNENDYQPSNWGRIFKAPAGMTGDEKLLYESEYVRKAFESARKYSRELGVNWTLGYNDFFDSDKPYEPKRTATVKMLKPIYEAGNIDFVGMQGRMATAGPSMELFKETFNMYSTVCSQIQFTESDTRCDLEANPDYDPNDIHEKDSIEEFEAINNRLKDAGWKAQFVSGIMYPLMNFISNLGYVGISIVGGLWITKSLLGLGDILAFIQYSRSFTMPIVQTANIANVIQSTIACAERVFQVLDEEEELADRVGAVAIESPRGDVTFEHVDFRYAEDVPLIENMNIDVKQGHTIAIVGPTGAGKTTLVNLLMRFYEINAGKISIDGVNINDIKRSELRKMFGMVLQDTWLYNGTIRDNIAYSKEGATMEEVRRAAKAAHADHFIRTLPEGYDTVLNEEATNISQGQKQLLTIARAILADPAILILDEATSSVDTRTEVLIQKAMANLMEGRTSFVIAHRLSTIRDAELILVMNKGSIIEMGNHKELLSQGGFYADLYNSQFTGANLEGDAV